MESIRGLLRFGAFLSLLLVLVFYGDGRLLNLEGRVLAISDCEAVRNGASDCSDPCWYYPPELPGIEITCGEFDGGSLNGHCEGYCGDGYCNSYDSIENIYNCEDDCRYCGDDMCDFTESPSSCSDDCGNPPAQGGPCAPTEPEDEECGEDFCNPQGYCCTGIHSWCDPDPSGPDGCAVGTGCDACAGDEVCRPGTNGNVWCITAGQNCTNN